jgi:HEAT repeat protein
MPIVLNKENGSSRHRFIEALGKIKSVKTENTLIELLDDDEAKLAALRALGRMKSGKAVEKIKVLAESQNPSVKKEAKRTLKKIG